MRLEGCQLALVLLILMCGRAMQEASAREADNATDGYFRDAAEHRLLAAVGTRRMRRKRDENENVGGAFGRGVGFYIGEPCQATCNSILFHVYCNLTTGKCECQDQYPVNIDNRACVKAAKLGDSCEYSDSCAFYDSNAVCHLEGDCRCADGFKPPEKPANEGPMCLPAGTATFLDKSDITTMVSVICGLIVFTGLFCLALRLFSRARFHRPADRMASAASPPGVLTGFDANHGMMDSRRPSRSSGSTEYLPGSGSRRASYSMLAPPSSMGSRRASSASVRSQLSFRSHSSFRGYRCSRDAVRRTLSSPADSHYPQSPRKVMNHHHHHPLHHNSPVDDDMREDSSSTDGPNINHHLANHI